ncbi:N-acetyltransferase [Iocasia frigidifontis]|uniref:N-acetyltransferase n=1 Tax=Iocasia fonsfrigidae TaxID=2682810 RepID=A0A8A7KHT8_9FIRM|nr:acyltransferase [Iocasia fonsfrigidae]QTL97694.1 N-acetyltransferase [Iocasia fonsfrigidae]
MKKISTNIIQGKNVVIGEFTVIKDGVEIGKNVTIGNNIVLYEGTRIGDNVRIDDNTVIGKQPMRAVNSVFQDQDKKAPPVIGNGALIGTGVVIYAGSVIGADVLIADLATVRENVSIGNNTIVGRNVAVENCCKIGANCKLETNAYLTAYSVLEDDVFIAPSLVTTNDNFVGRSRERFKYQQGVTVKKGGRIGANATILPGITINEESLVAAGSVVTEDTPARKIVMGVPAKVYRDVPAEQLLENQ